MRAIDLTSAHHVQLSAAGCRSSGLGPRANIERLAGTPRNMSSGHENLVTRAWRCTRRTRRLPSRANVPSACFDGSCVRAGAPCSAPKTSLGPFRLHDGERARRQHLRRAARLPNASSMPTPLSGQKEPRAAPGRKKAGSLLVQCARQNAPSLSFGMETCPRGTFLSANTMRSLQVRGVGQPHG